MAGPRPERSQDGPAEDKTRDPLSTYSVLRQSDLADTDASTAPGDAATAECTQLGRYQVTRLLGRGGMGSVYLGFDGQLQRQVAIKVPHAACLESSAEREAYLREARTLASLDHPRIVSVYDAGLTEDGRCYVVFKYVEGQTLADLNRDARLSPKRVSELLADVADALHHAHKLGFAHRDVKPANILIDKQGKAFVADFGLAVSEPNQRNSTGEVSGTPAYMAPEQVRGDAHRLDGRTDIWAVGVILYELLTARRPFRGDNTQQLFDEILNKEIRPPRMIDERIPEALERITLRCLRKPISERYSTAHDLARELANWDHQRAWKPTAVVAGLVALAGMLPIAFFLMRNYKGHIDSTSGKTASGVVPLVSADDRNPELLILIDEMRGLRQDLGETTSPPTSALPLGSASVETTLPLQVPQGEWASTPLPAGFSEVEVSLRDARAAGDEDREESLLLKATNDLIDAGHYAIAEHLSLRMVELAGSDPSDMPFAFGQLGLAQYRQGNYQAALASYGRALQVYQQLYDKMMAFPESEQVLEFRSHLARLLGLTVMRIGNVHKAADDYKLAKIHFEQARTLFATHERYKEQATLLLNFGGLESRAGNYEQAVNLLQEGLEIARKNGNTNEEAEFLVNLGNTLSRSGDNPAALQQYAAAYEMISSRSDYDLRSALLANWSISLLEEGEHQQALKLLNELQSFVRPEDSSALKTLEFLPALEKSMNGTNADKLLPSKENLDSDQD